MRIRQLIAGALAFSVITASTAVFSEEASEPSTDAAVETTETAEAVGQDIFIATNSTKAVVDGVESTIREPLLVFDRTYVELYDVGEKLGLEVTWMPLTVGYFLVKAPDGTRASFVPIETYDELERKHHFFSKDGAIYVSLRELCDMAGYKINYYMGAITLSADDDFEEFDYAAFGDISLRESDSYLYGNYASGSNIGYSTAAAQSTGAAGTAAVTAQTAHYVVNPYHAYSHSDMLQDAATLASMYPDLIKVSSIGQSVEGRELTLIEFGKGAKKIFVCAAHHAREYISSTYVMYAIDRYAYAYVRNDAFYGYNVRDILDKVTFCIVPMVNPDGVNLVQNGPSATKNPAYVMSMSINEGTGYEAWKANVNGVDVNWNYDKDWSSSKNSKPRGSTGFNGTKPATEPETVAMQNYLDSHSFDAYISFHTQGQIFYYADDWTTPTHLDKLIKNETGFSETIEKATGRGGSFFDYVYRKFKKVTMTFELCKYIGPKPYPDSDFDTVWKPAKTILLLIGKNL